MKETDIIIGIDLGTSGVKIVAVDDKGRNLGSINAQYPILGLEQGLYEEDTAAWTNGIARATRTLMSDLKQKYQNIKVVNIGLSAQMPTLVLMDEDGHVNHNAILWMDKRAGNTASRLRKIWKAERHYRRTGVILDGHYIIPMYLWWIEHDPQTRGLNILSAKDYIYYWLTGHICTDPSTASGFGVYSLEMESWDITLCAETGIDPKKLPQIYSSTASPGKVLPDKAEKLGIRKNTPVTLGCADSVAGLMSVGKIEKGQIFISFGTSAAILAVTENILFHPERKYLITPAAKPGFFCLEADILASGASLNWLADILWNGTKSVHELLEEAEKAPIGSNGVTFYPYLAGGEQGVLWDNTLTGGISGLNLNNNARDIARAGLESIYFEIKRCIEAFTIAGFKTAGIVASGHLAFSDFCMELLSDVLGLPVVTQNVQNSSAYGAALIAGANAGYWEVGNFAVPFKKMYSPNRQSYNSYAKLYRVYCKKTKISDRNCK